MFSRIHSLKFQNKLAKDTMKNSLKSIIDTFFSDGLLFSTFIEIDDVSSDEIKIILEDEEYHNDYDSPVSSLFYDYLQLLKTSHNLPNG